MNRSSVPAGERRPAASLRRRDVRLTERDLEVLSFAAEHRLVVAAHVQKLFGLSASAAQVRLRALGSAGFLERKQPFDRNRSCYMVTREGLAAIDSSYSKPRFTLAQYQHDVGVAWLWIAATQGVWGPMRDVISERRMRSADGVKEQATEPMGVRLGGYGPAGRQRLHYPDLLLVAPSGHRVALELELTSKGRRRLEGIIGAYAVDRRIDAVVYLVQSRSVGRSVEAAARRFGIEDLVHVQLVKPGEASQGAGAARSHQRARSLRERESTTSRTRSDSGRPRNAEHQELGR